MPKLVDDEETEEHYTAEDLKKAQSIVGELLWLSTRTRPDLSFGVGLLGRWVHKKPRAVIQLGHHMLKYVCGTQTHGLVYEKCRDGDFGEDGELQQTRSTSRVQAYADISFAPAREAYRSIQGIGIQHGRNLLAWETGRQPFVCASTAESELISYCEAHQVTESVVGLLNIAGYQVQCHLYGDNKAALAAATCESGSWRTRHLRLRAFALREVLSDPEKKWIARHLAGSMLLADGLTKPLQGAAFDGYQRKLGMRSRIETGEPSVKSVGALLPEHGATLALLLGSLGLWKSGQKTLAAVVGAVAGIGMAVGWSTKNEEGEKKGLRFLRMNEGWKNAEHWIPEQVQDAGVCQEDRALQGRSRPGQGQSSCVDRHGRADDGSVSTDGGLLCDCECGDGRAWKHGDYGGEKPRLCAVRVRKTKKDKEEDDEDEGVVRVTGDLKRLDITTTVTVEVSEQPGGHRGRRAQGEAAKGVSGSGDSAGSSSVAPGPWSMAKYEQAPKGADKWDLTLMEEGWLIRHHGTKGRVRPFHPIHRSCPVRGDELSGERITKVFNNDTPQGEVLQDRWMEQRTWQRAGPWKGYTFLRLKKKNDDGQSKGHGGYGEAHQDIPLRTEAAEDSSGSDEGYSFVSEKESSW